MSNYQVKENWSGYSRGYSVYEVEANSKEEAEELYQELGVEVSRVTVRDDTESDGYPKVTLIEEN